MTQEAITSGHVVKITLPTQDISSNSPGFHHLGCNREQAMDLGTKGMDFNLYNAHLCFGHDTGAQRGEQPAKRQVPLLPALPYVGSMET